MPSVHIGQALRTLAISRAHVPAVICGGLATTGSQLLQTVASLSSGLRFKLGLCPGDRVAIAALNSDRYLAWLLAVPCAGGIIAPLNYRWSTNEACMAVEQIEPGFLVFDQHCAELAAEIKSRFPDIQLITLGHSIVGALTMECILDPEQNELHLCWAPDSIALICFTSGTTGRPKGAAISHGAVIVQSLAKIAIARYSSSDVYLHTSPLCHIGGISSAHAMLLAGGCHVLIPKFQASDVLEEIEKHQVTAMISVPTMLKDLSSLISLRNAGDNGQRKLEYVSIRTILNGAGSLSLDLVQVTRKMFPAARILSAYGMTEACSSMCFITLFDPNSADVSPNVQNNETNLGGVCVGKPAPHVEIIVCRNDLVEGQGDYLNKKGDIYIRGPHVMEGYWGQKLPVGDGGWFNTGDVGWMDNRGQLWLLGRQKDIVKSGGENVHCYEIEEVLSRHPAVAVAAVGGVHDARLGEVAGAMLLLNDKWKWVESDAEYSDENERTVSPKSMYLFCRQQGLSRFKIPKFWCQKIGQFVTTSTGKIRKDVVREELAAHFRKQEVSSSYSRL